MQNPSVPAADTGLPVRWPARPRQAGARAVIESAIDGLIDLLDRLDPDPDLEPSLGGAPDACAVDVEGDDADLEETGDAEPALGAPDGTLPGQDAGNQERWAQGDTSDIEEDPADAEDDPSDREPWLGAPENHGDQTAWARGVATDCEATDTIEDLRPLRTGFPSISAAMERRALEAEVLALAAAIRRRTRGGSRRSFRIKIPTCD